MWLKIFTQRPPKYDPFQENKTMDRLCRFFLHLLPAYVLDAVAMLCGKKVKIYSRLIT